MALDGSHAHAERRGDLLGPLARDQETGDLALAPRQTGGAPLEGERHIWWNFVSSSRERIEQSKADWREGRFAAVPGETEFIPLPES